MTSKFYDGEKKATLFFISFCFFGGRLGFFNVMGIYSELLLRVTI